MRRRPLVVSASLMLAALALLAAPARAGAAPRPVAWLTGAGTVAVPGQEPDAPADDGTGGSAEEDESDEPVPAQDIIPDPNSGQAPEDAGDRGGALQILVFLAMVAALGGGVALMVRESRRARARRA